MKLKVLYSWMEFYLLRNLISPTVIVEKEKVNSPVIEKEQIRPPVKNTERIKIHKPKETKPPFSNAKIVGRSKSAVKMRLWQKRALELMNQFKLKGWQLTWMNKKTTYGLCNYSRNEISLSKYFVLNCDNDNEIEDVIRHEIGHALCGYQAGHGQVWKAMAKKVGYKPETCSSCEIEIDDYNYYGVCPKGHLYKQYRLHSDKDRSCAICSSVYNPKYLIKYYTRKEAIKMKIISNRKNVSLK